MLQQNQQLTTYSKKRFNWRNLLLIFLAVPLLASSFAFLNTTDAFAAITDAECDSLNKSGAGTKTKSNCHVRNMPKKKCEGYGGKYKAGTGTLGMSSCDIPIDNKSAGGDGGDKGTPSDPEAPPEDFNCRKGGELQYNSASKKWTCAEKADLKKDKCKSSKGKEYFWADKGAAGGACYKVVGEPERNEDADSEGEASDCQIDGGLGWLLCPVVKMMGGMTDAAYGIVAELLSVQPFMTTGPSKPVYETWKSMRNVANVAFVIAFLIIIFSQVTSIGFSNYNIKKMVPRLVMAAILVNISYWICAVAVDASNILGSSIKSVFDGMADGMTVDDSIPKTPDSGFGYWSGLVAAIILTTGFVLMIGLSALLPALVAAFIAILTVFIVLTARQAIIILLVVISPLAFVAMLLPNTENWFTRWRQLFQVLLLMFPIIAGIFGASALASIIIMNGANADNKGYKVAIQVMGALVSIIPLALTPIVMKTAGGMLNKIGAFVNNPNKGPLDAMRRGAQSVRDLDKKRMRANRLNPGNNRWHKATGAATRFGANMKYKADKVDARLEAAEAGFGMDNNDKIAAANLRSAAAGANSAASAAAIKSFDKDAAKEAIGHVGSTDSSLSAALRSQEKAGEDQMIKEFQNIHAPKDASELKTAFKSASAGDKANIHEAQAIQNILDGMGNKGADVMGEVLEEIEKEAASGGPKMSNAMRVELARNMGSSMMGKNEFAKTWATSTAAEFNPETGEIVKDANGDIKLKDGDGKNMSYSDAKQKVLDSEMKLDKIKSQSGSVQHEIISKGIKNETLSTATMQNALNPNNISSFESKDIKLMQDAVAKAAQNAVSNVSNTSSMKPASNQEIKVAIDTGVTPGTQQAGTLKVEHTYKNPPPASAPKESVADRNARIRDINRNITGN